MVSLPKEPDYTPSPPIQSRGEPAVPAVIALGSRKQAYEQQARTMAKRQDTVEAVNEQAPPAPVAPMSLKERMRLLEESKSGKKAPAPEPVAEPTVSPMQSARERFEHPRSYEAPPEPPHAPEVRSLRDAFERPAPPSPKQEPKEVTAVMSMKAMFDKPEQKPKPKPAVLSMAQQFEKPQPKAKQKVEPRHEFVTAQKHYEVSEPTAVQKMAMGMEAPKAQPKRKTQTAEAIASKKSVFEDKAAAARKTRKTAETEAITSMKEMFNKSPATSPAQSPREALKNKGANKGGASASRTPPAGFNLSPGGKGTATPTDVAYEYDPSTTSLPFPRTDSVISPILRSVQSGLYKDQVPQPQEVEEAREPSLLDGNFIVPPPNNTAAPAPGTTGQNRNEYTEREVRETAAGNVSSDNKSDEFFDTDEERLKILNQSLEAAGNNRSVERKSTGLKVKRASSTSGAQPAAARGQDPAPGAILSAVLDEYPPNPNAAVPPAQPPPDSTLFWLGVDQTTPDGRPPPNTVPQILPSNPQMQPGSQGSKGAPVSSKGPPVPTSTSGKFSMKGGSAKIIPSVNMISVSGKGSSKGPPVPPVGTTSMKSSKGKGKKSGFTPVSTPPDSDAERTAEVVTNSMPFSKGERPRRSRASQGGPTGPPKVVSASGDVPAWATPANTSNIPFAKGERVRTSGAKIRSSQATNASDGKPFAAPDFVSQLGSVQLKSAKVANPASKPKPMDVGSELANSMRMIREKRAPEVVFEAQGTNRI